MLDVRAVSSVDDLDVTFLEFKDKYKGKFFISDVMKDCVVSEYGPRFRWAVHENFLGKEVPRNAR